VWKTRIKADKKRDTIHKRLMEAGHEFYEKMWMVFHTSSFSTEIHRQSTSLQQGMRWKKEKPPT
jgi:hypothetical protein